MKRELDPWEKNKGVWTLTGHAHERLQYRFAFTEKEINEVIEFLKQEKFVRVPENNPRDGRYVLQVSTGKGSIFLICSMDANTVITVRKPFCHFTGEIPGPSAEIVGKDDEDEDEEEMKREPKKPTHAGVKLVQIPKYQSATGHLFDTEHDALLDNLEFQIRESVQSFFDDGRDSDERYITPDAVVDLLVSNHDELAKILAGEEVYPWPKETKK